MHAAPGRRRSVLGTTVVLTAALLAYTFTPTSAAATRLVLNQPSDPMRPTSLAPGADTRGMWSSLAQWPMLAIHAVLDQDGQLVTYGALITGDPNQVVQGGLQYDTWDPATANATVASHRRSPSFAADSFCSIAVPEQHGSLFIVGGNTQYRASSYDPATQTFVPHAELTQPRWYASMVRLPDDRMVVLGGGEPYKGDEPADSLLALTPEVYSPVTHTWSRLTGATSSTYFGGAKNRWWYPKSFVAPDGNVFGISYDRMFELDPDGAGTIVDRGNILTALGDPSYSALGPASSAIMYAPGKILLASGAELSNHLPAAASTGAITIDINGDINGATPVVKRTGSLHAARNWINLINLPDGTVAAVNGTSVDNEGSSAALHAEVWNPTTGTWTEMAAATRPRSYHSSALLMPNGSIFTGGGGAPGYPTNEENAEFFYPANLFTRSGNQVQWADRPEIRSMSGAIQLGGQLQMDLDAGHAITKVTLTTAGANTHSVSMNARQITLAFSQAGSVLTATLPTDTNQMPPGLYLLSAVDSNGVPSPSQIVEINADGTPGKVTVYGQGAQVPPATGTTPASTTTPTSTGPTSTVSAGLPAALPPTFTGITPTRLLDTRDGGSPVGPGSETVVPVPGVGSVALNVTVTNPSSASFLTVYPSGTTRPTASNLNVARGVTVPNMVIVPIGADGRVSIFNQSGTADVVVDLLGWFPPGGGFTGVTPARLADTRNLPTIDGRVTNTGPVGAAAELTIPVAGRGAVPSNATAVALNVTATGATAGTYLTVFPTGKQRPTASNLNVTPGVTSPNMVIVPVGANGSIDVFNSAGSTDVVVDMLGWFAPGSGLTGLAPTRLMDTRSDGITIDGTARADGALEAGVVRRLAGAGRGGVGAGPGSVVLNVTVTEPGADGYLTVFPTGTRVPAASNLNFVASQTIPNMVVVPVAADGTVSLFTNAGPVHVVVDVLGWFATP